MRSYLLRCRLQKRPHLLKKKNKSLPTLPNFFGVLTLNTHIFLFGPTKHAKRFEKMTELTYPGPRIDPFTSHAKIYVIEKCSYFCSA